ncbi:MAG: hypothetical protein GPOALKHO_001148 [Sodalis sp.]|nr:MAG: hypothetical protein GPOALKHO_001148 [Sodalis sp.]
MRFLVRSGPGPDWKSPKLNFHADAFIAVREAIEEELVHGHVYGEHAHEHEHMSMKQWLPLPQSVAGAGPVRSTS